MTTTRKWVAALMLAAMVAAVGALAASATFAADYAHTIGPNFTGIAY